MPKLSRGRLDGLHGMHSFTAAELFALADKLQQQALDPSSADDPRWLKRWAAKVRRLAAQKKVAHESKVRQKESRRAGR